MTYFTSDFFTSFEKRLQIAEITISGSPAADGYYIVVMDILMLIIMLLSILMQL